jgi:hypothetical protein
MLLAREDLCLPRCLADGTIYFVANCIRSLVDAARRRADRRYSTLLDAMFDATRRCSTILDFTRRYVRRYSTQLDAARR